MKYKQYINHKSTPSHMAFVQIIIVTQHFDNLWEIMGKIKKEI